jgi:hypothetical protein
MINSDKGTFFNPNGVTGFETFIANSYTHRNLLVTKSFYECFNKKVTVEFLKISGMPILKSDFCTYPTPETIFTQNCGTIKYKVTLFSGKGMMSFFICWISQKGKSIHINDDVKNCEDMQLWFEQFDKEQLKLIRRPEWTLFPKHLDEINIVQFKSAMGIELSKSFLRCADKQLTDFFVLNTGLNITEKISLHFWPNHSMHQVSNNDEIDRSNIMTYPSYIKDNISSVKARIFINSGLEINEVNVKWKSLSGEVYSPSNDVKCNDLKFWIERFESENYKKQFFKEGKLPFELTKKGYTLKVQNIDTHTTIIIEASNSAGFDYIISQLYNLIDKHNNKSEKIQRKIGIIHNINIEIDENKINLKIDLGSVGSIFIRKILILLGKFPEIKNVIIQS